ncbi:MAG: hypothetical protein ACM3UZ_11460 [Acidobacteriota bacterium]
MDQNPGLHNLLLNIIYELTSPNKENKLQSHHMIGILSLTNLLGIVNYLSMHSSPSGQSPAVGGISGGLGEGGMGDLIGGLMQMIGKKSGSSGGGGPSLPELNPQNLMVLLNMLSSLGQRKKGDEDHTEIIRETI